MSKHIFWIASYPKSGNTLLRLILYSLFFTTDGKSNLSHINSIPAFEKTIRLDKIKNINNEDFKKLNNLNVIYKYINLMQSKDSLNIKQDFQFIKTHSALISYLNFPFTTKDRSLGYIYILRDPRDVVISWSKHNNINIQESINFLRNETALYSWKHSKKSNMPKDKYFRTLLTDWGTHVKSWTEYGFDVPKLILNYEDLVYNKDKTIIKIVNFFREKFEFKFHNLDKKIDNIIKSTNFKYLKQKELEEGFAEAANGPFFREGRKNQWKKILNKDQIKKIENKFSKTMLAFGYELSKE